MAGLHRSPYHGFSVEFTDYRQYSPGDDPRYLDWKLLARTDRTFIKRFEDETNLRCTLIVDQSKSMSYGSLDYTKSEFATSLAATMAYFLNKQRDAVGLLTFDETVTDYVPARYRTGQLRQLLGVLDRAPQGKSTDVNAALEQVANVVSKRGMVVLISDLLIPLEDLKRRLSYLVSRGHDVILFRILDPAEINFDFSSEALFEDLESQKNLYVNPRDTRQEYLQRFDEHAEGIKEICESIGVELYTITTSDQLEKPLLEFIGSRARKTSQLTRRMDTKKRSDQNRRSKPLGTSS